MSDTDKLNHEPEKVVEDLMKNRPRLHWGKLRIVGSLRILSVIPFIGASIVSVLSLPQFKQLSIGGLISDVWTIGALIFFAIGLFSTNILYHIFCPPIIKKFEDAADLYHQQLQIKKAQKETYPDDKFQADLIHVVDYYVDNLYKNNGARRFSIFLFVASTLALLYFICKFWGFLVASV